ncbi:tRNA lysidine(34) synthetase TilS [Leucobacter sp. CSA2]|uniref:tRNA(Ile)-lysidine synthase n=1 Tax=Leucobacter edaphi TaxID=2796472 RepID=A0A934UY10_9MICO|nr:tRNA lysidine(34) synthetase TilS [Leucobacter edaphi]MBK0422705.1 tRNA lysidine(34) synthetase TilS [Leucobacter edaphi]
MQFASVGEQGSATGQPEHGLLPAAQATPPTVLVALSGGADSLALAAAVAREASALGLVAGAIVIDHGLQDGSADVAAHAAAQAEALGLDPVLVRRADVAAAAGAGGPEAAARDARFAVFAAVVRETGAIAILTAHTRDDQAEQVLLGLARGSGIRSLAGIRARRDLPGGGQLVRPFLASDPVISREITLAACAADGLTPWHDPHNTDPAFARVRVRNRLLPFFEHELGPGIAAALARTADLAREDADALDQLAVDALAGAFIEETPNPETGEVERVELAASALVGQPPAIRNRAFRLLAADRFRAHLSQEHTLGIAALVTSWRGQGPVYVPGIWVERNGDRIVFTRQHGSPRKPSN